MNLDFFQGPLPETFADFWRMVWETRTGVMVQMATRSDVEKEEEGNGKRVRCVQYFL